MMSVPAQDGEFDEDDEPVEALLVEFDRASERGKTRGPAGGQDDPRKGPTVSPRSPVRPFRVG